MHCYTLVIGIAIANKFEEFDKQLAIFNVLL